MKRKAILAHALLAMLASFSLFAAAPTSPPIQRIDVVNMLWNPSGTNAVAGLSPTSVVIAFNNGGAKPCFTTTLAFQGSTTVLAGTGQACVAKVTDISITPVAGPSGAVYATPGSNTTVSSSAYSTQIVIEQDSAPVFDATNGTIATAGVLKTEAQSQLAQD